ncbi:DUF1684 domain-containing protein [Mucilaginibacter litoreus]|uniref:DUF1684 domain-containing protein n=1 Tax=Mucilaginibacter litoreus TaxID=1048221 RepID=A0ABW3AX39_9SPHI
MQVYAQSYTDAITEHRKQYKADFLSDSHLPLKEADLPYLQFYNADSTFKVMADIELLPGETVLYIPTFAGAKKEYVRFAIARFQLKGKPYQLSIYRSLALAKKPGLEDYLFLPFTDETNGNETYGGGRYLDLRATQIKDGKLEIDFNKAYNPYCAYSDGYQCPMPPPENDVPMKIEAGEKQYTGQKKH